MEVFLRRISLLFSAGIVGGLINSVALWALGSFGVTAMMGIKLAPKLTPMWLYPRMVWGGIWGLTYFLAVGPLKSRRHWARKGLWISLLPTAFQLLVVYPYMTSHAWLGLDLGQLTPLFIFAYNLTWGLCTGVFCRIFWGRG